MIPELSQLLRRSVAETLEDRVAVSFSGGLDSTLIAAVAKRDAATELFSCGTEGAEDLRYAEEAAKLLGLPLRKSVLDESAILETYRLCHALLPEDLLKVELLVPVYRTAEMAKASGHEVLLFGCGAEELFVGYERYYSYLGEGKDLQAILMGEFKSLRNREISWVTKVCRQFGVEARFPFYNRDLEGFVRAIPLERLMEDREKKKGVLREAGKLLGLPELVLKRRKHAMQYGSGVHKVLLRHSDSLPGARNGNCGNGRAVAVATAGN